MPPKILVTYASRSGSTAGVGEVVLATFSVDMMLTPSLGERAARKAIY